MGDEQADQIVATFQSSLDQNNAVTTFEQFLTHLDNYFNPRTNIVAQRAHFFDRRQRDGESNEEFIRAMFALVDKCNYGVLKDEQLRDKLCHGMQDRKLAADLRSNEQLTLEEVLKRMRSKEAALKDLKDEKERIRDTVKQVRSELKSGSLDAVSQPRKGKNQRYKPRTFPGPSTRPEQKQALPPASNHAPSTKPGFSCKFCGTKHKYGKYFCPSKDSVCQSCKAIGHFAKMCPKKLKSLTYQEESDPESFSDSEYYVVCSVSSQSPDDQWRAKVQLGRYLINFKVDSGADVTALSLHDFEQLSPRPLCKPSKARLVAAGNQSLETVGVFMAGMKYHNITHHEKIFVIKGLDDNLLSRSASNALFVVEFKGDTTLTHPSPPQALHSLLKSPQPTTPWDPKKLFPECFSGLGLMAAEYKITLRNGVEPYAIATPRRIPHPIKNQVKSQLDQMVVDGVISPVHEPTEWCAALVPVPKASDPKKIRICVDHINLNKAIIRERTILPSVEETMAKFAGAKIFSKLDCKDSFWQDSNEFIWDTPQQKAFEEVKKLLVSSPILTHYDASLNHRVASDASLLGIGAVLEQEEKGEWKPVSYASRRLTETESRYAVIEREALGIVWACQKFHDFIMGKMFSILTDHKPLVTILGQKNLSEMTPRLQRLRLKLLPYSYDVQYIPGKDHHMPDWLSRSPSDAPPSPAELKLVAEVTAYGDQAARNVPVADKKISEILKATSEDPTLQMLISWIKNGFPPKKGKWGGELSHYWAHGDCLTEQDGLVLYKTRIIIPAYPSALRTSVLQSLHDGHQSLATMRARAQEAVYWPGLSVQLAAAIDNCVTCLKRRNHRIEPMIPSETPIHPWEKVSIDVADIDGVHYLVTVDRYSRYPEISLLPNLTSASIIHACKENFSRHGIPSELMCDNATPLVGQEFKIFLEKWGITQVTSSPHYPKSNGQAESAVKVIKRLMEASDDPYLALLAYRNTPILGLQASPAQLSMGRNLRSTVPVPPQKLLPAVPPIAEIRAKDQIKRAAQKTHHDARYKARTSPALDIGTRVWIKDLRREGRIVRKCAEPRSFMVQTARGTLRRNNIHLTKLPEPSECSDTISEVDLEGEMDYANIHANIPNDVPEPQAEVQQDNPEVQEEEQPQVQNPPERRTRSGRQVKQPRRLNL
ncbi:hypothetical protein B566_EDAN016430 [Ephemera danica]|nr:hypothetical protein B566_EDAN016430 [Ephemera danica]